MITMIKPPDKTNIILAVLNSLFGAAVIVVTATMMSGWSTLVLTLCYVASGLGIVVGIVFMIIDKQALLKSVFVLMCCALVFILVFALTSTFGDLDEYPTDGEKIERLTEKIKSLGSWGMAVFVLIQILQVVILPLPALVCYVPGSAIWGPGYATLLASVGVILGSLICYVIGKFFGKKVVIWIAGKENTEKYVSILGKRGKVIFVLMQILPFFPDDILCLVAGLTSMNFPFFIISILIVRPCIIAAYCYLGSGTLIPFSGWGIPVWIAIAAVCVALAILSVKYQDRFEKWLTTKISALRRNKPTDPPETSTNIVGAEPLESPESEQENQRTGNTKSDPK